MPSPWMLRAARKKRDVQHRRQNHAEHGADEEHAPLIGAHDAPPAAPSAHVLGVGRENEAGVRELHFVSANRGRNVSRALPHAVALVARPARQRDVHHASGAGVARQRGQQQKVGIAPAES